MLSYMRTTVTLDADTEALVRALMEQRSVSFKVALNDAIRAGATKQRQRPREFTTPRDLGTPTVNLDRALLLAGDLEDEEILRKMRTGR